MNLKDAVREAYIQAIKDYYGDKAEQFIGAQYSDIDERIGLEDLLSRIDSEINLATDELEYNIPDEEDEEDE